MPEATEGIIEGKCAQKFVNEQPIEHRTLRSLLYDSTKTEMENAPQGSLAAQGHVHELKASEDVLRGQRDKQTGVYPPMYADPSDIPISSRGLVLCDVVIDPRNVILKFCNNLEAEAWVQIQLLKHTVLQIYDHEDWTTSICQVSRKTRGFKVAIAFEFEKHVMAFLSLDLLFQIYWANSRDDLFAKHPDVYSEFRLFLTKVVEWMKERRALACENPKTRSGNAMAIARDSGIFPGVGVYTASEIFHRAGLSPFLTEAEVFDSPSRTARLCAALYHFTKLAHTDVWDLVQKHMHGYVIAVERKDRLKYAKMLLVHGKEQASVSNRFLGLYTDYQAFIRERLTVFEIWRRSPDLSPCDIFEPSLIRHALEKTDQNLGSLIFGKDVWGMLCSNEGLPTSCISDDNPLSEYFLQYDFHHSWLNLKIYDRLFVPVDELKCRRIGIIAYRISETDVWSIYPTFPKFSEPLLPSQIDESRPKKTRKLKVMIYKRNEANDPPKGVCIYSSAEKSKLLLSFLTQHTGLYTVGPLDYCGIARLVRGRGVSKLLVCDNDLREKVFYARRHALAKETAKIIDRNNRKQGLSKAAKRKALKDLPINNAPTLGAAESERPVKRRRLSADKHLVIDNDDS